jgi:hypothetical protein
MRKAIPSESKRNFLLTIVSTKRRAWNPRTPEYIGPGRYLVEKYSTQVLFMQEKVFSTFNPHFLSIAHLFRSAGPSAH